MDIFCYTLCKNDQGNSFYNFSKNDQRKLAFSESSLRHSSVFTPLVKLIVKEIVFARLIKTTNSVLIFTSSVWIMNGRNFYGSWFVKIIK